MLVEPEPKRDASLAPAPRALVATQMLGIENLENDKKSKQFHLKGLVPVTGMIYKISIIKSKLYIASTFILI
jgi:hypothetical protein